MASTVSATASEADEDEVRNVDGRVWYAAANLSRVCSVDACLPPCHRPSAALFKTPWHQNPPHLASFGAVTFG